MAPHLARGGARFPSGERAAASGTAPGVERSGHEAAPLRILIVEDDPRIAEPLADDLRRQRHVVDVVGDGEAAVAYGGTGVHDVVLLDVLLPRLGGIAVCRALRAAGSEAMILMLTALDGTAAKVDGLDAGADDYLVKPFDYGELAARLRALERRRAPLRSEVLRCGALSLDAAGSRVRWGERSVALTPTEFALLEHLMRSPARVFSRELLLERVAPFERAAGSGTIKTHVTNLRRKLRAAGCPYDPIETLYGHGYRLSEPA